MTPAAAREWAAVLLLKHQPCPRCGGAIAILKDVLVPGEGRELHLEHMIGRTCLIDYEQIAFREDAGVLVASWKPGTK